MSSQDLIRSFQEKNNVQIDSASISVFVARILKANNDNLTRESKIKAYIMSVYPQIANEYERNKVQNSVYNTGNVAKTNSWEFFEGYMNIVSEITKETAESMVADAKKQAEDAKLAVEEAKVKNDAAKEALKKAHKLAKETNKNINIEKYETDARDADIAFENAMEYLNTKLSNVAPYKASMDFFGITGDEARTVIENQMNSYTYIQVRRSQIESTGVAAPAYMIDLKNAFQNKVSYKDASFDDKRKMQEVYVTKQLMQEKLDSRKGFIGWLWKLFHPTDTNAMTSYIAEAQKALDSAAFDSAAGNEAMEAMSGRGYFLDAYRAAGTVNVINEKLSKNELSLSESEIERVSKMPIKDQFFEFGFRPSKDEKLFNDQVKAYKEVKTFIEDNQKNLPEDLISVFKSNSRKLMDCKKLHEEERKQGNNALERLEMSCKETENKLMRRISFENYEHKTFEEYLNSESVKIHVPINLDDTKTKDEVSAPVDTELSLKKDPIKKIN